MPSEAERLLSVREVALQLGVTTATIYKLCARGELPAIRVLNVIRGLPADLRRYLGRRL
jgi:excisionase family DNA binding protein